MSGYVSDALRRYMEQEARQQREAEERARQRVTSPDPASLDLEQFRRMNMAQRGDLHRRDPDTYRRLADRELGDDLHTRSANEGGGV